MRELIALLIAVAFIGTAVWAARLAMRLARGDRGESEEEETEHCPECGYDLRAGHRRCPECGIDVTPEAMLARGAIGEFDKARLSSDWPVDAIEPVLPGDAELLAV